MSQDLGLEIEVSVIESNSSNNYPTCLKFDLDEDTELNVLEIIMCHTSV